MYQLVCCNLYWSQRCKDCLCKKQEDACRTCLFVHYLTTSSDLSNASLLGAPECDICGQESAVWTCDLCNNKQLCDGCDKSWHRHSKRRDHRRNRLYPVVSELPTCDICGQSSAQFKCEVCNDQMLCVECDNRWHLHPKRCQHTRAPLEGSMAPPGEGTTTSPVSSPSAIVVIPGKG